MKDEIGVNDLLRILIISGSISSLASGFEGDSAVSRVHVNDRQNYEYCQTVRRGALREAKVRIKTARPSSLQISCTSFYGRIECTSITQYSASGFAQGKADPNAIADAVFARCMAALPPV
jgi:hypothetical protein